MVTTLAGFEHICESLSLTEQARFAWLLIEWVIVSQQGLIADLRTDSLSSVVRDMLAARPKENAAWSAHPEPRPC